MKKEDDWLAQLTLEFQTFFSSAEKEDVRLAFFRGKKSTLAVFSLFP